MPSFTSRTLGSTQLEPVAQFAPAIIGGIYWKGGTRLGATCGLAAGFLVWVYTLLLPSFAKSAWLPILVYSSSLSQRWQRRSWYGGS